jgi:hypothetical protein
LERRRVTIAVSVGLACQIAFLLAYETVQAEHYAERARRAIAENHNGTAATWAQRALVLNPHQGYAAYFAGSAARRTGRTPQATDFFRRALRTMAHRTQPLRNLVDCERGTADPAIELAHLAELRALDPRAESNAASSCARFGQLLMGQGTWADGLSVFRSMMAGAPDRRFLFDGLTVAYEHFGAADLATASALAMLGTPRLADRASDYLLRLSRSPGQRETIRAAVEEMVRSCPAGDPRGETAAGLLKRLATSD